METKTILDTILKRLITEVDMRDMYSLADPRMCREYIVVATSALLKLFASIRLSKDKDGVLLFQKIRGIQDKNPDAPEQQTRCKELAFFFVRIFQVYAAIALSIMDTELPATDPLVIGDRRQYRQRGVVFIDPREGFRGFAKPQQQGWMSGLFGQQQAIPFQQGGAIQNPEELSAAARRVPVRNGFYLNPGSAGAFKILNKFLIVPSNGMDRESPLRFQKNVSEENKQIAMGVRQDSLYSFTGSDNPIRETLDLTDSDNATVHLIYDFSRISGTITMEADLNCRESAEPSPSFTVTLKNVKVTTPGVQVENKQPIITKVMGYTGFDRTNPVLLTENNRELPSTLEVMFKEAYQELVPGISAAEFLSQKGLILSMTGQVPIQGTNVVTITNPINYKGAEIPITYTTRFKIDERTIPINIDTDLIIIKGKKSAIGSFQYTVKVDFNKIRTRPDYIFSELNIPYTIPEEYQRGEVDEDARFRGKRGTFSTGVDDRSAPTNEKGETIPIFLERIFKGLLEDTGEEGDARGERTGVRFTREGLPEPLNSKDIPETMRIKEVWKALAKDPPVKAHCVARAMQLLNVAAIRGNETREGFSSICNLKFAYATDGSLPPAGKPITEEYGIQALAMLFVDKLQGGFPQVTATDQYKNFRKRFKLFFERYESSRRIEDIPDSETPQSIAGVTEYMMPGLCEGHTSDRIQLDRGTIYQLRSITQDMMNRQASHLRNAMSILFELFDERAVRAGRVEISSYIENGGMAAVNQVAERARNMLAEYYGDCEKKYKDGLIALHKKWEADKTSITYTSAGVVGQAPQQRPSMQPQQ